jgi:hypothetical protein
MNKLLTLASLLGLISLTTADPTFFGFIVKLEQEAPSKEVLFTEGFLNGAFKRDYTSIEGCMKTE